MDDRDSWMRRYINQNRIKFINTLNTELFIVAGFPGLHEIIRNRATCQFRQDGFFLANSLLIESIVKIDDFPDLFIAFCEKHDINPELVRIVRTGLQEYDDRQNHLRRRNERHRERALPPLVPGNRDQDSASTDNHSFPGPLRLVSNNINENTSGELVSQEGREEITDDGNGENAARLVNPLESTTSGLNRATLPDATLETPCPCPYHTNVETSSSSSSSDTANMPIGDNELETSSDTANMPRGDNELETSSDTAHMPRGDNELETSSDTANISRGDNELETSSDTANMSKSNNELETSKNTNMQKGEPVPPSCTNKINNLPSESTTPVCNPNIDRGDLEQKYSHRDKATFMAEHVASSDVNVSSDTKRLSHEINSAGNSGHLKNNTAQSNSADNQFQERLVSKENTLLENVSPNNNGQNVSNNSQRRITLDNESWGSFYLSSSDEEELLQNAQTFEIDSLKEIPKSVAGDKFQRERPTKVKFIAHSTGHSGIPCQEDLDKFKKPKAQTQERVENNVFSDENKKHGGAIPEYLSDNTNLSKDSYYNSKASNNRVSDDCNTLVKTVDCEDTTVKQKSVIYSDSSDDCNTLVKTVDCEDTTVKQKSVIYSDSSDDCNTLVKTVDCEDTTVKQKSVIHSDSSDDCNTLVKTVDCEDTTVKQKSVTFSDSITELTGSPSSLTESISENSFPTSAYSGSSEGFKLLVLASDVLETADSDVSNINRPSDHASEGSQQLARDMHILENSSTEKVSTPSDTLSTETGTLITLAHSDGQQMSNTSCQTMEGDNSICTLTCQNDGSNHTISFSELNQPGSEHNSLEDLHQVRDKSLLKWRWNPDYCAVETEHTQPVIAASDL